MGGYGDDRPTSVRTGSVIDTMLLAGLGVNILIVGAAWGDLRRQVSMNRDHQNERHSEVKTALGEISRDIKRINGTVARHDQELETQAQEIARLREA